MGFFYITDLCTQEKTHLLWWALQMCSVAVNLAPTIIQSCSKTKSFSELSFTYHSE